MRDAAIRQYNLIADDNQMGARHPSSGTDTTDSQRKRMRPSPLRGQESTVLEGIQPRCRRNFRELKPSTPQAIADNTRAWTSKSRLWERNVRRNETLSA